MDCVTRPKILSIDFDASSFAGIAKSTSRGSALVSTIAKMGMLSFCASRTAMCSRRISTTKSAPGKRVISEIEPRFFSSLARIRSTCSLSFLERVLNVPSVFIRSIAAIFLTAFRIVTKLVSIPPGQRSVI